MSQKSSVPQAVSFVSQALKRDKGVTIFDPITDDDDLCEQVADRMVNGESFALMIAMSGNNADDFIAMARGIVEEVRQSTGDEWNVSSVIDPNKQTVRVDFVPVMVSA